jgi:DNA-binding NtrC family response regulator
MSGVVSARVLVVEDDPSLQEVMCAELRERGQYVVGAESVAAALAELRRNEFDVALLDLMLPDGSGIDVLRAIADESLAIEAIVLTGYAALDTAIEAMKLGAYDYLTKPTRMDELELLVRKAAEKAGLRKENASLRARLERQDPTLGLVGEDKAIQALLASIDRIAVSDLPVLIQGESGTGKELVARALHRRGDRAAQPFVAVNCAAIGETLLESELFGHEKGAFTGAMLRKPGMFELADRGVLFLDEVGEIAASVQSKLLRAVETREFYRVGGTRPVRSDVRIVSASNRDLKREAQEGRFREDLYFRLNGVTLVLPPLRDRPDDIPLLALFFLNRLEGKRRTLTHRAIERLKAYPWPGNVRELQMVIRRAALLSSSEALDAGDIPLEVRKPDWRSLVRPGLTLDELEREYIAMVLKQHGGHRGKTAAALGLDAKTLYNKLGPERPRRGRA